MRYHLDAGVEGVAVAGSTGGGNALSVEEHGWVCRVEVEGTVGEIPVVTGVIRTNAREVTGKATLVALADAFEAWSAPPRSYCRT